jgi:hypothetical protein
MEKPFASDGKNLGGDPMDLIERLTEEAKKECCKVKANKNGVSKESKALSNVWNRFCDSPEFQTVDAIVIQ